MDVWDRLSARGTGWYWMVGGLRNGDLYHVCSLAAAFAEEHGRQPIYLVTGSDRQVQLASLFSESFAEIIVAHGFPLAPWDWEPFFKARGLPWFGLDVPLLIHPQVSLDRERFSLEFIEKNGLTWMQLYKQILHLAADVEPSVPVVRPGLVARAKALCEREGVIADRSVILFPYAQSLAVRAQAHFARLARDLREDGHEVFTSVSNEEVAIEGTKPIFIPFELLLDVSDHAGWIVAVRSGICDITSSTRCRKSFIYPNIAELSGWSMSAMDLTQDAYEVMFDFRSPDIDAFSALIRSDVNSGALAAPVRRLSSFVAADREDAHVRTLSFAGLHRGAALPAWLTGDAEETGALVIAGVPPRRHARLGATIDSTFAGVVAAIGPASRIYVCRDRGLYDYYEELAPDDLIAGRYSAGWHWHSIVVTRGATLPALLPGHADAKVLELDRVTPGERIEFGMYEGTPGHLDAVANSRPLSAGGVQFVEGWSFLEPWGLWSDGYRSTLKLTLPEAPADGAEVELLYVSGASPLYPFLSFDVLVDDAVMASCRIDGAPGTRTLRVPLAPAGATRRTFRLTIAFAEVKSPYEQGNGGDRRRLGIGLVALAVEARADAALDAGVTIEGVGA